MKGTALNMKSFIRLTNAVTHSFGGVCQRTPTGFTEWLVEIEFSSVDGNMGSIISFLFSKECCPNLEDPFTGMAIWINTTETDESKYSPIYFSNNQNQIINKKFAKMIGKANVVDESQPCILTITHKTGDITIEFSNSQKSDHFKYTEKASSLLKTGYFSIYAATNTKCDANDIFSIRTLPLSPYIPDPNAPNYSLLNRKIIQDDVLARRSLKTQRRSKMILTNKYTTQEKSKNFQLDGIDELLSDAFVLLQESLGRGEETVSLDDLMRFLSEKVELTTTKALKKVNLASERIESLHDDLKSILDGLETDLLGLKSESRIIMDAIGEEALKIANKIISEPKMDIEKAITKNVGLGPRKAMMIVCIIEFVCYIIFFVIQHRKTHGFKKID
ncbi:Legume-like lectin family protein [Histomonas meleagridis]|uniref:Legume-like lectin family protein n=1 Tax=Histomonas meleagridis TaxID=135588 RepID=UPI0035598A1B|nr:Legume-like lectin family protein [Histomonas meleagridis]KAH0806699.1 Legume-like lectin family protein [Histomonas meleagridis]